MNRKYLVGFALLGGVAAVTFSVWKPNRSGAPPLNPPPVRPASVKPVVAGELDPVLAVLAHGGTPLEIALAIESLDTMTRLGHGLTDAQHAALISALQRGTPAGMSEGAWSHLFNCSCNVLAVAQSGPDEALIGLLVSVAVDDPRLVMRLYALQHLGVRYDTADSATQQRLRALVQSLLTDPNSQTAGTALVLWRRWEKSAEPGTMSSFDLSLAMAADTSRSVDVRVTALHAIGDDPRVLDLARAIAPDPDQPVILRKAAINLIGRHGEAGDLLVLRKCGQENPRLAQAGTPAVRMLEDRIAGKSEPVPVSY